MQGKLLLDKSACQVHTVNVNVLLQKTYSMSYGQLYRDFVFFFFFILWSLTAMVTVNCH